MTSQTGDHSRSDQRSRHHEIRTEGSSGVRSPARDALSPPVEAWFPDALSPSTVLRPLSDSALDDKVIWSLVDAAPDGIVLADESGQILLVNRQTEELFGYDRGELLGRSVEQLLPERFRSVHSAHRTRYRVEPHVRAMGAGLRLYGRRSDGREFPVEVSLSPVPTDDGLLIVAAIRDVTERVAAEARAREVREILDATRDAVSIFDAVTLQYTYVNQGLLDQIGYQHDELLDMTMLHIAPEFTEAQLRALLARFEQGITFSETFTTLYRHRDGTNVPVEILMQAISGDDGCPHAYVNIARDIGERLEAEVRQRRTEQQLRVLEDRERLARDLHDLVIQRLFAAGMAAQSLHSRLDDPQLAERADGIIDELDKTILEIRTVIFGLQHPIGSDDGGFRARLLTVIEEERPALGFAPHIYFDGQIETTPDDVARHVLAILREALSNVARHAHASAVEISVEARDQFVLCVTDNGIGLGPTPNDGDGLRNMTERARALGGALNTFTGLRGGTTVECRIPTRPA